MSNINPDHTRDFMDTFVRFDAKGAYEETLFRQLLLSISQVGTTRIVQLCDAVKQYEATDALFPGQLIGPHFDAGNLDEIRMVASSLENFQIRDIPTLGPVWTIPWPFASNYANFKKYISWWLNKFQFYEGMVDHHGDLSKKWQLFFAASECLTPAGFYMVRHAFVNKVMPTVMTWFSLLCFHVTPGQFAQISRKLGAEIPAAPVTE